MLHRHGGMLVFTAGSAACRRDLTPLQQKQNMAGAPGRRRYPTRRRRATAFFA
jgi:hypothetical protein